MMNDCRDLQVCSTLPRDSLHRHAIVQSPVATYQHEDIRTSLQTENAVSQTVDAVVDHRDNSIINTVKTDVYKRNKVIKRYVARRHSVKHSPQEGCTLRSTTIQKCTVRNKIVRLSTIKTDVITNDTVRSYTFVEKSVKTSTVKNDEHVLSTERLPLLAAGQIIPPLLWYKQIPQ